MNLQLIEAKAKKYQELDKRLSFEVALTESILEQVIIDLDNKDLIPKVRIVDKS